MKIRKLICAVTAPMLMLSGCGTDVPAADAVSAASARETIFAFDTYMTFSVFGEEPEAAIAEAKTLVLHLERLWSVTDPDSELYKLDHRTENTVTVSDETAELLTFALSMSERTGGALDPTLYPVQRAWGFTTDSYHVPQDSEITELLTNTGYAEISVDGNEVTLPEGYELDLGAVAKGCAADMIAETFRNLGVQSAIIDLGGNILTFGHKEENKKFRIGIRDPFGDGTLGIIETNDCAVVTSGSYERFFVEDGKLYHHILDPKTGKPAESGLVSATAIGTESRLCDALSTSLFVMGLEKGSQLWRESSDFEAVFVTEDGKIYITEGLEDVFSLASGAAAEVSVIRR